MPDIAFAPRPMVDPYGGKTGEIVGELFSTIGQIHLLRQQRNQSNAILDIMKSDWSPEEKQAGILRVAQNGGDVFRNMMARQGLANALVPESERQLQQANLERIQASTAAAKAKVKAGGAATSALEKQWNSLEKRRDDLQERYEKESDPAKEAELGRRIQERNEEMDAIDNQIREKYGGPATPGPTREPAETVGPPVPDIYGVVLKSFRSAKDISSADKQARKELVAKGLAKDDDQAASMILDAVGKMPSLNKIMPTGADTGQRPGAFVQAATAPQLARAQEPYVTNDDEYDALPSGTVYMGSDGKRRRKP